MQIIDDGGSSRPKQTNKGVFGIAAIFILAGVVLLAKNLGVLDYSIYRVLISWQMLLIAIGIYLLTDKQPQGGMVLIGIGFFFLIPHLTRAGYNWANTYWPLVFVIIGVVLLFKPKKRRELHSCKGFGAHNQEATYKTEDGFINSCNSFGSVRQIVLDPIFKGASISNKFGETVIDLRQTDILPGETIIYVDCAFGSVEIYVPEKWSVYTDFSTLFSGTEDKRFGAADKRDNTYKIIIKGQVYFSGIEIKN